MSDTPRTSSMLALILETNGVLNSKTAPQQLVILCRELERELNEANERINRLNKDSERLQWLLNRGLAWRDCYDDHWIEGEWLYAEQDAIETIDKAMEEKP